jgi:hypothetical protein
MAKKKNLKTRNGQVNQAVPQRRKKILGIDVRDLGAAIAAAVVSEIAQVAIQKSGKHSGSDADADKGANSVGVAQASAHSTVDLVKEAFTNQPLQHGASILAGAVNQVNPSLGKLANAVKDTSHATGQSMSDAVNDTVGDAVNTTQQTAEDMAGNVAGSVGDTVDVMNDTIKVVIQEATEKVVSLFEEDKPTHKKSKKGKNKSSQKKRKKKSKK